MIAMKIVIHNRKQSPDSRIALPALLRRRRREMGNLERVDMITGTS
jgi:hypothetical protein